MQVKFKLDEAALDREFGKALDHIRRGTQQAAQSASLTAQAAMRQYLMAVVYDTVPGRVYERTQKALDSLGMTLTPSGGGYLLTLRNDAPYAAQIELGNLKDYFAQQSSDDHVPQISADELALLLDGVAEDQGGNPLPEMFFERSGLEYQVPGPHVTPAAVKAMYDFMRRLEAVWAQAGKV